jgi:hypothetical protein
VCGSDWQVGGSVPSGSLFDVGGGATEAVAKVAARREPFRGSPHHHAPTGVAGGYLAPSPLRNPSSSIARVEASSRASLIVS